MIFGEFNLYSSNIYLMGILGSTVIAYLLCIFIPSTSKRSLKLKSFLAASPMSIVLGLRSMSVGYDTYMYTYYFYGRLEALPQDAILFSQTMVLLNKIFGPENYTIMLLFFSYATVFLAFYAAEVFNPQNNKPLFVLTFCLLFGLCITDQFRQLLGCSLFLMAISHFANKEKFSGVVYLVAGVLTHSTVIIALIIYLICGVIEKKENRNVRIILSHSKKVGFIVNPKALIFSAYVILVMALFFFSSSFLNLLINIAPESYLQYFTTRLQQESVGLGLILDSMIIIPLLFLRKYCISSQERTIYLFGFFIPVFRLCGYMSYFLYRMLFYPELAVIMLYAVLIKKDEVPRYWKYCIIAICALFYFVNYVYLNNHGAFPYTFYFE